MFRPLFFVLPALFVLPAPSFAAVITAGGYQATDEAPFAFTDIVGLPGTTRLSGGRDTDSVPVNLPFAFTFYGTPYSQAFVSVDGFLTFEGRHLRLEPNRSMQAGPSGDFSTIAPHWGDLWFPFPPFPPDEYMHVRTDGDPGSRTFTVQWNQVRPFDRRGDPWNFQAVLFEGSNEFEFRYLDVTGSGPPLDFGGRATVGIRNRGALTSGEFLQWSFNQPVLRDGLAIRFSPIPEPSSLLLLSVGSAPLLSYGWRAMRRKP